MVRISSVSDKGKFLGTVAFLPRNGSELQGSELHVMRRTAPTPDSSPSATRSTLLTARHHDGQSSAAISTGQIFSRGAFRLQSVMTWKCGEAIDLSSSD